ncbi:hypothetical protein BGY98DRAFT_1088887 [Russula aff. rugulosa BPL654]|nr:hypothetical protein BGY98DRAFT_1088887 [Russula aff. rugulosa BPL654]
MALFTFALLAIFTASLASAGPVAVDNATLLLNGQEALVLNCQFQALQVNDPCNDGDTACIQGAAATCVNGTWQTSPCSSSKSCFALPQVRTNGTFIACTSSNNAASIIAATGIQTDIANNCTSLGNTSLPFSAPNSTHQGVNGTSPAPGQVPSFSLTLPPTTTTLSPEQVSSLFPSASGSNFPSVPTDTPDSANNLGGNSDGTLPVILLTSAPVSSPIPTLIPTSSSVGSSSDGGY